MENGDKTKREESGADNNSQNSQALIDAINMRSMSLITLTSIATLYFIDWAQAVLLPLVVAVLISYALEPLVATINRLRVPRPPGGGCGVDSAYRYHCRSQYSPEAGSHGYAGQDTGGHRTVSAE